MVGISSEEGSVDVGSETAGSMDSGIEEGASVEVGSATSGVEGGVSVEVDASALSCTGLNLRLRRPQLML